MSSGVQRLERLHSHVPERDETQRRSLSPRRLLGTFALAAWAALFWFLLVTNRTSLYLSSRTDWVVPVGAVLLTAAVVGRLFSLYVEDEEPLDWRSAGGICFIVLPVVVVTALPPASLTSYAASRRSSFASGGLATSAADISTGELSLADVAGGLRSREGMRALVTRAGSDVTFTGFVTRDPGQPADEFILTRFMISCCVADALSIQVRVVGAPPGGFKPDDWVQVAGQMYPLGREVIVDASEVRAVPKPKHPYLNP
jgi:uncharacterized repeat protein (TIGR03943 family)